MHAESVIAPSTSQMRRPAEPRGVSLFLQVCSWCHKGQAIVFLPKETAQVSALLGMRSEDLMRMTIEAMVMGQRKNVAYFRQRDLAEQRLHQLRRIGRFMVKPCHQFYLVDE